LGLPAATVSACVVFRVVYVSENDRMGLPTVIYADGLLVVVADFSGV